jgi:hypothetical protein
MILYGVASSFQAPNSRMLREHKSKIVNPRAGVPPAEQRLGWEGGRPKMQAPVRGSLATPVRFCRMAVTHGKNYYPWLKFVAKDFENDCVIDCAFQFLCSRTAAKCNDIFNRAKRRFGVERSRLELFCL